MLRHFAFFAATPEQFTDRDGRPFDGCRYVREFKGHVDPPRDRPTPEWMDSVSGRRDGEICLDVTQFDYPEGDFVWMIFRPYDATKPGTTGLLDWPFVHLFVEIERATMRLSVYCESSRPIRSNATHIVVDITGTPFETFVRTYGTVFGALSLRHDRVGLILDGRGAPLALSAVDADLDIPLTIRAGESVYERIR